MSDWVYVVNERAFHEILPDGSERWTYPVADGPAPTVAEWTKSKADMMVRSMRSGLAAMFFRDPVRRKLMEYVLSVPVRTTGRDVRQRERMWACIRKESRRLRREKARSR